MKMRRHKLLLILGRFQMKDIRVNAVTKLVGNVSEASNKNRNTRHVRQKKPPIMRQSCDCNTPVEMCDFVLKVLACMNC